MASWFEHGRSALFEALEHACQQIDDDISTELSRQSISEAKKIRGELDTSLALIEQLKEENERLRHELAASRKANHRTSQFAPTAVVENTSGRGPDSPEPSAETPRKSRDWKAEYIKVGSRFNVLSDNFKLAKLALERRKEEKEKWMDHANFLERRIKSAEQAHGIRILDDALNHRPTHTATPRPAASNATMNSPQRRSGTASQAETESDPVDQVEPQVSSNDAACGTGREMGTELPPQPPNGDLHEIVRVHQEPSSDEPLVISEHAVRKRKRSGTTDDTAPRRIKDEPSEDSEPPLAVLPSESDLQESLDLGDVTSHMATPRKPKDVAQAEEHLTCAISQGTTPTSSFPQPHIVPRTVRSGNSRPALTPVSTNRRLVQTAGPKIKTKSISDGLHRGIASVVEDGSVRQTKNTPDTLSSHNSRLSALLNNTNAEVESPLRRKVASSDHESRSNDLLVPHRRELPFERAIGKAKPASMRHARSLPPPRRIASTSREEPSKGVSARARNDTALLRNRPLSELRSNDFKVNPQANEGHDYAFSEVVRDKNERACLPGCTDMHCCGTEFRALAASQRPKSPLTAAERQEEQALLENFLGDFCYRLAGMTPEERYDVWLQAKTQELANKYGKHRHRHSRMQSPPGFWEAEFPSTQELQAEKAEAAKREKAIVQERYREAMKPGGRWIFRDE